MSKLYRTITIAALVIAWKGTENHTAEEIAEIKSVAIDHDVIAKVSGEQLHLLGFNGTHIANPGDFAVFQANFYETVDRETLDRKYESDDPYPAGGAKPDMFPQSADPGPVEGA